MTPTRVNTYVKKKTGELRIYETETSPRLAEEVRRLRTLRRLTQKELADRCGFHYSYVSQIETKGWVPNREKLCALADALHVSEQRLLKIVGLVPFVENPKQAAALDWSSSTTGLHPALVRALAGVAEMGFDDYKLSRRLREFAGDALLESREQRRARRAS